MTRFLRYLRDLWIHLGPGLLCAFRGKHRELGQIGDLSKKGFRGIPIFQCHKCMAIYVRDGDAKRIGGRIA